MSVTTVAALPRLALMQTLGDSIAFMKQHRRQFVPVVVVLAVGLSLLQPLLSRVASDDVRVAVVCLVHLGVYAGLAYMWCRLVLLGRSTSSGWARRPQLATTAFDGGAKSRRRAARREERGKVSR